MAVTSTLLSPGRWKRLGRKRELSRSWGDKPELLDPALRLCLSLPGHYNAQEPDAQPERPNSQHFKTPPWKLFGCSRPGLFLAALGRVFFSCLVARLG